MPLPQRPSLRLFAILWLITIGAFWLGTLVARRTAVPEPEATAMQVVMQEILRSHVIEQDAHNLADIAIKAMAGFDHYGQYVPHDEVDSYVEATTGNYAGIGIAVLAVNDRLLVRFPFLNGPSAAAGLLPGDEIIAIEGIKFSGLDSEERQKVAETRIRGEAGSKVRLTIKRADAAPREVEILRGEVHKSAVKWAHHIDAGLGIGYLWLSDFHPDCDKELVAHITALTRLPCGLHGLILDLRFNGGGYLDVCVAMANLFLPRGVITTVKKRGGVTEVSYLAQPEKCQFPDLPLVILVNQDSASASEVLTGALQDHGRALVVGELSYGKGMVNTLFSYKNLDFKLKVTTGHYVTPNGRDLEGHHLRAFRGDQQGGIVPDRAVPLDGEPLRVVFTALTDQEPPPEHRTAVAALLQLHGMRAPAIRSPDEDPQLAAALAALRTTIEQAAAGK